MQFFGDFGFRDFEFEILMGILDFSFAAFSMHKPGTRIKQDLQ